MHAKRNLHNHVHEHVPGKRKLWTQHAHIRCDVSKSISHSHAACEHRSRHLEALPPRLVESPQAQTKLRVAHTQSFVTYMGLTCLSGACMQCTIRRMHAVQHTAHAYRYIHADSCGNYPPWARGSCCPCGVAGAAPPCSRPCSRPWLHTRWPGAADGAAWRMVSESPGGHAAAPGAQTDTKSDHFEQHPMCPCWLA